MRFSIFIEKCLIIGMMSVFLLLAGCGNIKTKRMVVSATAYTSDASQTHKDHPTTTAWGDELKPGMKCIAVSRDLIPLGLTHNKKVKIEGLPGKYEVLDKMNKRWKKKIDIYMGNDKEAAMQWGIRKVTITWQVKAQR